MKAVIHIPDRPGTMYSMRFKTPLTDEELEDLCRRNEINRIERTREGVIQVVTPTGLNTGGGNSEINAQLRSWSRTHERGKAFDSNTGFYLPDGSMLSPDASYLTRETLARIPKPQRDRIPHVCPDFIIELISETDTLAASKKKMTRWLENGVKLGWLIEPKKARLWIYKPGGALEAVSGAHVDGSGPVEGFRMNLEELWQEYR